MNNQTLPLNIGLTFQKNGILQKMMSEMYNDPIATMLECDKYIDLSPEMKKFTANEISYTRLMCY